MQAPWNLLLIPVLFVLLLSVVWIVDRIFKNAKNIWRQHVIDEFPYPDECWDCNLGDCDGCKWADFVNESNPILDDIPWKETKRTSLPSFEFRAINEGGKNEKKDNNNNR